MYFALFRYPNPVECLIALLIERYQEPIDNYLKLADIDNLNADLQII